VLALATLAAFAPGLPAAFTNWDDDWLVVENPWIARADVESVATILDPAVPPRVRDQLGSEYLPLRDLSYLFDHFWWGLVPVGYHLTSLLLHVVGALALAGAAWRVTRRPALALGVGAVFALHPVQVEAVTWVASRKDVLAGACGALAALCWADFRATGRRGTYAGSLLL
jgi:hypothetical protein